MVKLLQVAGILQIVIHIIGSALVCVLAPVMHQAHRPACELHLQHHVCLQIL